MIIVVYFVDYLYIIHRDADKSLAWPGRKQATTRDFDFHISYL